MAELANYKTSDRFSPLERHMIAYAEAMTQTPVNVPDELFEALAAELSPAQLVELTATIALENFRARFHHAFGVESANFYKPETSSQLNSPAKGTPAK
ncbi:MAG: hypothetical protein HY716_03395 [Planctomycetes bacterium]|nr:hypothetical protein [Planctomycetota bacterium]